MVYYISEDKKRILKRIKVEGNNCKIAQLGEKEQKIEKVVRKMKQKEIKQVVLSKELKKNKNLIKKLNEYDITILDGKWLMQHILKEIMEYLMGKQKIKDRDIAILANDLTNEVKQNIMELACKYKEIRIVTNHLEKVRRIEKELYKDSGISLIITNNKRKALSNSFLIINFDFVQELINQYSINEKAIVINMSDTLKINKKRFCGFIIGDYEVEVSNFKELNLLEITKKQDDFYLKEILEEQIYSRFSGEKRPNFIEVRKIIENCDLRIKKIIGSNGVL